MYSRTTETSVDDDKWSFSTTQSSEWRQRVTITFEKRTVDYCQIRDRTIEGGWGWRNQSTWAESDPCLFSPLNSCRRLDPSGVNWESVAEKQTDSRDAGDECVSTGVKHFLSEKLCRWVRQDWRQFEKFWKKLTTQLVLKGEKRVKTWRAASTTQRGNQYYWYRDSKLTLQTLAPLFSPMEVLIALLSRCSLFALRLLFTRLTT